MIIGKISQVPAPEGYVELVDGAIRTHNILRLSHLAREMAHKMVLAERQLDFIIAQLREVQAREQRMRRRANANCRNQVSQIQEPCILFADGVPPDPDDDDD